MRTAHILSALSLPFIVQSAFAAPPVLRSPDQPQAEQDKKATLPETIFNNKTVPPLRDLSGLQLGDTIKSGNWLVEFFSPYCSHCKSFAPTWQTLYEYYYTQNVPPPPADVSDADLHSFTGYYDFHFARVDCVANGDSCREQQIGQFPTVVYFKDGQRVKANVGARDMKFMTDWIEETLDTIRPGTRPIEELKLPKTGDHEAPPVDVLPPRALVPAMDGKSLALGTKLPAPQAPNPLGKSIQFSAEKFQKVVTMTRDPWFVKFYTPWCSHCQDLAPNWQGMAKQMKDQLNVGEVNCETEKRLCKDVKVRGYPTIMFFRGGERIEYDGLRGLGDLLGFAHKAMAVSEGVRDVTAAEFEEMETKEEVIFLYLYDHATTSEDFAALERLVMSLIGHAKLVKSNDPILNERFKIRTWPRLLVSRDGKPTYYNVLAPQDMRDFRKVLKWMKSVWLPIVPELTAGNAHEIMDGKLVVLGILSRSRAEEFISAKREIKNAAIEWIDKQTQAFQLERQELRDAKQLRIEEAEDRGDQRALRAAKTIRINMDEIERKEVGFAWVDGVFWERWIRTTFGISVAEGEKVVINDEDNKRYWDVTATGNPITPSRTSILETLRRVVVSPPSISPKSTTTPLGHVYWVLRGQLLEHPVISFGVAATAFVALALWSRKFWRSTEKGYFRVGEKGGPIDGLLGANAPSGGKVD